ncbi:MAG: hypothetical protein KGS72_10235 [Cyanobacteria bacterium REEB67]|nr:hypothetical protein [Cyanobacteria bacterium REEB67]
MEDNEKAKADQIESGQAKSEDVKSEEAKTAIETAPSADVTEAVSSPEAVEKTPVAAAKAKPPRRYPHELTPLDIAGSVLFLVILSLLMGNCYIAYLGQSYNQRICSQAIALAGDAANKGMDTPSLILASYKSWEDCPPPGFFVEHPEFTSFKDEITPELRVVTISTKTKVRFPAHFLIFDRSSLDKEDDEAFPHKTFNISYQYRLSNPGNIENKIIRGKDGRLITVPVKDAKDIKDGAKAGVKSPASAPTSIEKQKDESKPKSP